MDTATKLLLRDLERKGTALLMLIAGWEDLYGNGGHEADIVFSAALDLVSEIRQHLAPVGVGDDPENDRIATESGSRS